MNNITIKIQNIRTNEIVTLTLDGKAKDRHEELNNALAPFQMYFGDDVGLYEENTDEHIANLVSDSCELSYWLMNEE